MRRAARVDANQKEIVNGLRAAGYSVAITSQLGSGFPDIVVGVRGQNFMFEIKDSNKPPSARKLTDDEEIFHAAWQGQIAIAETVEQIIRAINADICCE